jgi:5-methyltetrahydrofolate--homocysteine methyltransferase
LPECKTLLGVSNVSFGLNPASRIALNSVFLHEAREAGLDAAIVHAGKMLPLNRIGEREREVARQLIYDERKFDGDVCTYDPLGEFTKLFEGVTTKREARDESNSRSKSCSKSTSLTARKSVSKTTKSRARKIHAL